MTNKWVSAATACETLKISIRTLQRWVKQGKIPSRDAENGGKEYQIDVPNDNGSHDATKAVMVGQGITKQIVDRFGAELEAIQAQSNREVGYLKEEIHRSRRLGVMAWIIAIVMIIIVAVGATWYNRDVMMLSVEANRLRLDAEARKKVDDARQKELDRLRDELRQARQVTPTPATQPTTRPAKRWLNLLFD